GRPIGEEQAEGERRATGADSTSYRTPGGAGGRPAASQAADGIPHRGDPAPRRGRAAGWRNRPAAKGVGKPTGGSQAGAGGFAPGPGEGAEATAGAAEEFRRRTRETRSQNQGIGDRTGRCGEEGRLPDELVDGGDQTPRRGRAAGRRAW